MPSTPTRTATMTPTAVPRLSTPRLLNPENGLEIRGSNAQIKLSWEPAGVLAEDEWYALSVRFLADGVVQYGGTWTNETNWMIPSDLYMKAGQFERAFQWDVIVMRQTGTKPDGGREGAPISAASETRAFFWY